MATSMLTVGDPEEVISCPYNKSHQILRKRMQTHLVRCKKNYPDSNLVECSYNAVHKIPEPELRFHLETCPDRCKIDSLYLRKGTADTISHNKFPIVNIDTPAEECWDSVSVPSYDPVKKCETATVLRQLNVESAAKRRNFRIEERQRLSNLTEVKTEINRFEKEKAIDFAQRADHVASSATTTPDVDENDPYQLTSLIDRIRLTPFPLRLCDNKLKMQLDETDTDATISDAERQGSTVGPKMQNGRGRGKFIKKGDRQ